jgi:hypothetical protein
MALLAEMFNQHMRAIGVITVRWSSIDGMIYDILRKRLLLPERAEELRFCNAGTGRLDFFRARLKESCLQPEEKNALDKAIGQLLQLWEDRNKIVHGQYGIMAEADGGLSVCWSDIKMGKGKELSKSWLEPAQVTVDHLDQHAAAVSEAATPLRNFLYQRPDEGR